MVKKSKSIRTRLLFPMFVIMSIQAVLFFAMILFGGVFQNLKVNAIDILGENAENSRLYLEKEIVHRWINVIADTDVLTDEIGNVLQEQGRTPDEIRNDPELNRLLTESITQQLIDLLHRSYATGIFVVFDGPAAVNQDQDLRSGIYIRDLDTSSYALDNSDLLLARGLPSVSKAYNIALDSFWELGYSFKQGDPNSDFFYKPYNSALEHSAEYREAMNFGYLSKGMRLNEQDQDVITYSIPLILKDGSIIGVVGLDMTMSQIQSLMDYNNLDEGGNGIFVLGVRKAGTTQVHKVATTGALYNRFFANVTDLNYTYNPEDEINIISAGDRLWYAAIEKLDIYANNTPFEEDEWLLLGMVERDRLLSFYDSTRRALLVSLLIPILLSLFGVFIAGNVVTKPISRLVEELKGNRDYSKLSLKRLHINEIDRLTDAIEKLSCDVAQSASRISTILENANISIGVFEIDPDDSPVFCSSLLSEMLGWGELEEPYIYMPKDVFEKKMEQFQAANREWEPNVYYVLGKEPKWLKLITVEQAGGRQLGVLSDITNEMLERLKLERERDYDLLTDLYNRRAFREKIEWMISETSCGCAAMVMWDLDNLKYINDTYGHDEGDRYIRLFADKLRSFEKKGGIVSRYSGDEFVTFLHSQDGKEPIRSQMNEFMGSLKETTMVINDYAIPLRVSAGLAWYPDNATTFELLLSYADFAMYTVKHSVKGIAMEFDPGAYSNNSYLLSGREELNRMFENQKVDFAFQPIIDRCGRVFGYELLMRPKLKNLKGINEILNLARVQAKLPQMEKLTWNAGLKSFAQQADSGNAGTEERIFINSIASTNLTDEDIAAIEANYQSYLGRLVIEVTESEPLNDLCLKQKINMVKRWNALIAIDDFGAGYNSESVLLQIDPDIVKLDMNLVRNIDEDVNRQILLKNIMAYTSEREIITLAEGVETEGELKILMEFGVDLFQGFYLARPELEIRPVSSYVIAKMQKLQAECGVNGGFAGISGEALENTDEIPGNPDKWKN